MSKYMVPNKKQPVPEKKVKEKETKEVAALTAFLN
jgi:hypothetical protein